MSATKFATLVVYLLPIALAAFGARLIAQENRSTTLFERVQSMPVAPAAADSIKFEVNGIVRKPDLTEAQAVVFCINVEPSKSTLLSKTTSDDRGHFSLLLSVSEQQNKHLMLFAIDSEDRLAWHSGLSHLKPNTSLSILLHESSGRIAGKLIAPRGESVDGLPVKIWAFFEPVQNGAGCSVDCEPFEFKTTSDANGDFAIEGLPASTHAFVKFESEKFDCLQSVIATSADMPADERRWGQATGYFSESARIRLFPVHELQGTVVDSQGNPIAGVEIDGQHFGETAAVSDALGRFTIHRLNPTALGPSVPKDYFEIFGVKPPAESRFASTTFQLDRSQFLKDTIRPIVLQGARVSGRVLSATTKQPLAGIQIREKRSSGIHASDADGRFQFSIAPGPHDFQFSPSWMGRTEATQFVDDPKSRAVR
ncbi:MAG: carboxypeptidase regulatory-like domain-containing protein, partial [Aureliella sp.]